MKTSLLTNYGDTTFLEAIKNNLRNCKEFMFTVSFIKKAGLVLLWNDIRAAVERGAKGRMITSTYQNFTDIESLRFFLGLMSKHKNFQCHLDDECFYDQKSFSTNGFHTKGYLFVFENRTEIIVGSTNITRYALLKNVEWDLVLSDTTKSKAFEDAEKEYSQLWNQTEELTTERINNYAHKLNFAIERWDMDYDMAAHDVKPNYMQRKALRELNRIRALGEEKALIIAATGSGKTYLAAFDALNFDAQKLLYVVHEESILDKSRETFNTVFSGSKFIGKYAGGQRDFDADFLFCTYQSLIRSLEFFGKEDFDYIIIDECHHAASGSYQKIINYFQPEFLLGLTATPERMDNQDVYEIFGNNVPYELRLRDALINDLIVPFRYYGIRDQLIDYNLTRNQEHRMIAQLATEEHCDLVAQQIEKYRLPNQKLKALAFCRSVSHARMMAEGMGNKYKTAYISGANKAGERIRAYNELQSDRPDTIEILFAIDVLNEGVDIPCVNMVLFLRPTESSTIFIQQLGRGLRKYENKEYVTVLDFIGNSYKRSVQIALALGSLSKNFVMEKRLLRALLINDFKPLGLEEYGVVINIDDLSKEEILEYVDNENFYSMNYMKQGYYSFKKYINTPTFPSHIEYLNSDVAPDLMKFMSIKIGGRKTCCYYNFLKGIGEESIPTFSDKEVKILCEFSQLLPLVRKHEFLIGKCLLENSQTIKEIEDTIKGDICDYSRSQLIHALKCLEYSNVITIDEEKYSLNIDVSFELKEHMNDLFDYGIVRYDSIYGDTTEPFVLWQDYSIGQVQRKLLKNPGYNGKGTYIYGKKVYVFASIKKDISDEEKQHLNYKDKFLEPGVFQWECEDYSASHWTPTRIEEAHDELKNSEEVYLFIRKVASENGIQLPFTFVGKGKMTNARHTSANTNGTMLFDIKMNEELPDYLQFDFGLSNS